MPSIADAYEAIKTAVETAFPNKTEFPNPYAIEFNNVMFLKDGYGIAYGPARESTRNEFNATWSAQVFEIKFTREVISLESNADPVRDAVALLHADILTAKKAVLDPTIYESGINYIETSAPEMFEGDKQIISMTVTVVARTQDTL